MHDLLCAGVDGGFDAGVPQFLVDTQYAIVVLPEFDFIALDAPDLPEKVANLYSILCQSV